MLLKWVLKSVVVVVGTGSIGRCVALDQASGWITLWIGVGCDTFGWRHMDTSVSCSFFFLLQCTV